MNTETSGEQITEDMQYIVRAECKELARLAAKLVDAGRGASREEWRWVMREMKEASSQLADDACALEYLLAGGKVE